MTDPIRVWGHDPFSFRKPTPEQIERIQAIRQECSYLLGVIEEMIPPCRERSLAITKLEEVSMWANRAIVFETDESGNPPDPR